MSLPIESLRPEYHSAPALLQNISTNIQLPITLTVYMLWKSFGHVTDMWKICACIVWACIGTARLKAASSMLYLFPAARLCIDLYTCEQQSRNSLRWGRHQDMQNPSILYNSICCRINMLLLMLMYYTGNGDSDDIDIVELGLTKMDVSGHWCKKIFWYLITFTFSHN